MCTGGNCHSERSPKGVVEESPDYLLLSLTLCEILRLHYVPLRMTVTISV